MKRDLSLKQIAESLARGIPDTQVFSFGSILSTPNAADDVDLLVICQSSKFDIVRKRSEAINHLPPIHLIIMDQAENDELNFIERTNAQPIIFV